MKSRCFFRKCRFNCSSKTEHKIVYAKMKSYYSKKKLIEHKPSSKVNWNKYNELFK